MRKSSATIVPVNSDRRPFDNGMLCNFGPVPTMRTYRIKVTMLGNSDISVAWPQRERVGLLFRKGQSPLSFIERLLKKEGFRSAEELREVFPIPSCLLTCRDIEADSPGLVKADPDDARTVLRQALILGLCGPACYDPNKAVIWTNNRLSRTLDLFEPGRWYADN